MLVLRNFEEELSPQTQPTGTHYNLAFLFKDTDEWDWRDLRDFVVQRITLRGGTIESNPLRESGIFKSFLTRYGKNGPVIAKIAFDVFEGVWYDRTVTITSFCKAADEWFADPILRVIEESQ